MDFYVRINGHYGHSHKEKNKENEHNCNFL